jgi:UrcA family protein
MWALQTFTSKGDVMNKSKSAVLVAAVCALGFGVASVAGAQAADTQTMKFVVEYSPASLASESGVRQLYGRLVMAAERVCGEPPVGKFVNEATRACRKQAVADAVAQVHNLRLAEISAGSTIIG